MTTTVTDKKAAILRAAMEAFAEKGFHDAPTSLIAKKANVGVGSIYRYFKDKDELIHEIHREIGEQLDRFVEKDYPGDKTIKERFLHLWSRGVRFLLENPAQCRFVEQYKNSPYGAVHKAAKYSGEPTERERSPLYEQLFQEGVQSETLKDLPLPVLYNLAFAPLMAVVKDHLEGFVDIGDASMILKIAEASWDAIRR